MSETRDAAGGKITCQICGALIHAVRLHLKNDHPETTLDAYQAKYPHAPLMSDVAKAEVAKAVSAKQQEALAAAVAIAPAAGTSGVVVKLSSRSGVEKRPLHEVFELGKARAAMNARGEPIPITVIVGPGEGADLVPEKDPNYIHNIGLVKTVLMGLELNIPTYLWGHAGVGKTTQLEQIAAATGRPFLRIQHTVSTEESHIVGQWTARNGNTFFELGPLPTAMLNGWMYCADEYDFGLPSVLSVYQPVLEGKPLVIKEAPPELRVIRPHPQFRIAATGNTNGAGDDTGLYQGTILQNAANYERFGIVEEVGYMPESQESSIVAAQAGIIKEDAEKLVRFATEVRKHYIAGKISNTVSPRAIINAAKTGMRRQDWKAGISLAFSNRLPRVDREVVNGLAQRLFG